MKIKIPNAEIQQLLEVESGEYPKYSTQLMNLANRNAQGTRPSIVGQMSELIQQFEGAELEQWRKWYLDGHPDALSKATEKVWEGLTLLNASLGKIDKELVAKWVEELVVVKTFVGLKFQDAILKKIAEHLGKEYRLALPEEESKGIDGFINEQPVSIKPETYKLQRSLNEAIDVPIVYYDKKKTNFVIEFTPSDFD